MIDSGIRIETDGVGFVYPDGTRALREVTIAIEPGTRVAIVGQNGSGKSTLVRHFNGLLRATEGTVLIDGREIGKRHVAELARSVGIAFQNPDRQIFASKVRSEVGFGPRNLGMRGADLERAVTSALVQVGLADRADFNPYDLGFSDRKLLALASVVAMGTPAIVLDEPTTGQDHPGVRRIADLVHFLAELGRTVITITHDMAFATDNFERVVVMRSGQVVLDGSPDAVFAPKHAVLLASTGIVAPATA